MNFLYLVLAAILVLIIISKFNNRGIHTMDIETALELIKDSTVTILDVRTPQEFSQGRIQRARLIPVGEINDRIKELLPLKDQRILVYCHSGNRSTTACRFLEKNGFSKVFNLDGGITAWTARGNTIVTDN